MPRAGEGDMDNIKTKKIGVCFNLRHGHESDAEEEYDAPETIDFLVEQLESFGFEVCRYEQDDAIFSRLLEDRPRWVMNIAEGKGKTRARESQIPALLEWLNIPYYGSDPIALGITLDKALTNRFLRQHGLPVPEMFVAAGMADLDAIPRTASGRPYIVKPRWEGSSKGIFHSSRVEDIRDCRDRVRRILQDYGQPAVIEEFVAGDEVTVAVIGHEAPRVLGMMRISAKAGDEKNFVYSLEHKRSWQDTIQYDLAEGKLPRSVLEELSRTALAAFQRLELRDVARIDFRLDDRQRPRIIDINPLPGLSPEYSDLMLMSRLKHEHFPDVVRNIMRLSLQRCRVLDERHEILHCGCP